MLNLQTPDLCAQLDRMKRLCDRLEAAQHDHRKYDEIVRAIDTEIAAFKAAVCSYQPARFSNRTA
jgi:hypothetical protein